MITEHRHSRPHHKAYICSVLITANITFGHQDPNALLKGAWFWIPGFHKTFYSGAGFPFKNFMWQISRSLLSLGKSSDDNSKAKKHRKGWHSSTSPVPSLFSHLRISLADFGDCNCYAHLKSDTSNATTNLIPK